MKFVLQPWIQALIVASIASIVVTAFVTHQTTALGAALTSLASALGMFFYRSGWLVAAPVADLAVSPEAAPAAPEAAPAIPAASEAAHVVEAPEASAEAAPEAPADAKTPAHGHGKHKKK